MNLSIVEINEKNFNKEFPKILKLQEKIKNSLKKLGKGNELFFTNSKEELLKEMDYKPYIFIGIKDPEDNLCGYGLINKNLEYYKNKTIDPIGISESAQIDIIAVDPDLWGKKLGTYILKNLESRYTKLVSSTKTILATVSPYNIPSLILFLKNGYYINGFFKKHNKFYRVIIRKDLNSK